jgi:hypothetical protein
MFTRFHFLDYGIRVFWPIKILIGTKTQFWTWNFFKTRIFSLDFIFGLWYQSVLTKKNTHRYQNWVLKIEFFRNKKMFTRFHFLDYGFKVFWPKKILIGTKTGFWTWYFFETRIILRLLRIFVFCLSSSNHRLLLVGSGLLLAPHCLLVSEWNCGGESSHRRRRRKQGEKWTDRFKFEVQFFHLNLI